jgi:hypothetical protein
MRVCVQGKVKLDAFYDAIKNVGSVFDVKLKLGTCPGVPAWKQMPYIFDAGHTQVSVRMPGV